MLGINSVAGVCTLYDVNLVTGATTSLGVVSGLPAGNLEVGLSVDSQGRRFIHDIASDDIFRAVGLVVNGSIALSRDTNFSQGMVIDWSANNAGYHGAIGNAPAFYSRLFTFDTALTFWNDLGTFGTADGVFPTVETGDLAIRPIPEPATLGLLGVAGLGLIRRRR